MNPGDINTNELCDDGNGTSNDGCSSTCQIEDGYNCTGVPSQCTRATEIPAFSFNDEPSIPVGGTSFGIDKVTTAMGSMWAVSDMYGGIYRIYKSTSDGSSWAQIGTLPTEINGQLSLGSFRGELWLLGGLRCGRSEVACRVTSWHSANGLNWQQGPSFPATLNQWGFDRHLLEFNNTLFSITTGGTVYSLSDPNAQWQATGRFPEAGGGYIAAFQNKLWTLRGRNVYASSDGNTWQRVSYLPTIIMSYANLVAHNGKLWIFANADDPNATVERPNCFQITMASADGINWSSRTDSGCRLGHEGLSFNGKVWIFPNYFSYGYVKSATPVLP